jgi:hypothetical protein
MAVQSGAKLKETIVTRGVNDLTTVDKRHARDSKTVLTKPV